MSQRLTPRMPDVLPLISLTFSSPMQLEEEGEWGKRHQMPRVSLLAGNSVLHESNAHQGRDDDQLMNRNHHRHHPAIISCICSGVKFGLERDLGQIELILQKLKFREGRCKSGNALRRRWYSCTSLSQLASFCTKSNLPLSCANYAEWTGWLKDVHRRQRYEGKRYALLTRCYKLLSLSLQWGETENMREKRVWGKRVRKRRKVTHNNPHQS